MNKIEEFERDLKVAYLNYENNDLQETLKYLDRMLETILKEDKSLENDPFWKTLTCDVFKAIVLNNFYNKIELTGNDLDFLLGNEEELKKNIKEFCHNFRNNELINFISHIENIAENPLKDVIKILMNNIGKMNIADIKIETTNDNALKEDKIQEIDCFCGKTFKLDWDKIPNTEKFTYVRCPFCDSERKLKNMYFEDNGNKSLPVEKDIIEVISNQNSKSTYKTKKNIENIVAVQNISYLENNHEVQEKQVIFAFTIIDINDEYITIKTNPMCEVINGKINLNNPKTEFKLYKNLELTLATPTMDRGNTYKLSVRNKKSSSIEKKYPEKSYGIFVDVKDLEKLKIYSHTYTNIYGHDPKRYSPIDNIVLPQEVATNWIIDNNSFKIIKENISIWHGNNHDEEPYVEKLVLETYFRYSVGDFMSFVCEKDGEQFTLIPSSKWIKINGEDYNIPEIEIHNYTPEKLGLINSLDIK